MQDTLAIEVEALQRQHYMCDDSTNLVVASINTVIEADALTLETWLSLKKMVYAQHVLNGAVLMDAACLRIRLVLERYNE